MAIKYKELKDKIEKTPLTPEELKIIKFSEDLIDEKIHKDFKGGEVWIDMGYVNFTYRIHGNPYAYNPAVAIPDYRKALMRNELERRYKAAGWKCKSYLGEDDGPSRPAMHYWILSGKSR